MLRRIALIVPAVAAAVLLAGAGGLDLPAAPVVGGGTDTIRLVPGPDFGPITPRFYTWNEPLGRAADDPRIVKMVRKLTGQPPAEAADAVCDEILFRGLGSGDVAVALQNFGMGDGDPADGATGLVALWRNWGDAVHAASADHWWMTTWMSHGIDECRSWMDTFLQRYHERQLGDPTIPDPDRFHFDTERPVVPHFAEWQVIEAFDAMRDDPRFVEEVIPGHGDRTLAQLYAEVGSPRYDPTLGWVNPINRAWSMWYTPLCFQAMEAAMDEAAYQPIRDMFPDCRSSNYSTSAGYDGDGDPARLRVMAGGQIDWFELAFQHSGDIRAPVLYWAHPNFMHPGETLADASVRYAEISVRRCIDSFDGDPENVVPWIQLAGTESIDANENVREMSEMQMFEMLCMLKRQGVTEIIVWNDASSQTEDDWNDLASAVDMIWGPADRRSVVLGVTDLGGGDSQLFRLDLEMQELTLVGPVHDDLDLEGMASSGGRVVGVSGEVIDPDDLVDLTTTDVSVLVPDLDLADEDTEVTAMAADDNGVVWAFIENVGLATIDLAGLVSLQFAIEHDIQGLAVSDDGSLLWGLARTGELYAIDPASHGTTQIDNVSSLAVGGSFENLERVSAIELAFMVSHGDDLTYTTYTIATGDKETIVFEGLGHLDVESIVLAPPPHCPYGEALPLIGACCLYGGACVDVTEDECMQLDGVHYGWNLQCLDLELPCPLPCEADVNDDDHVGTIDLVAVLAAWDTADPAADIDGSGLVGAADLVLVISSWGPCP